MAPLALHLYALFEQQSESCVHSSPKLRQHLRFRHVFWLPPLPLSQQSGYELVPSSEAAHAAQSAVLRHPILHPVEPEELDELDEPDEPDELDELPVGQRPSLFARAVHVASSMHLRSASVAEPQSVWHRVVASLAGDPHCEPLASHRLWQLLAGVEPLPPVLVLVELVLLSPELEHATTTRPKVTVAIPTATMVRMGRVVSPSPAPRPPPARTLGAAGMLRR